ncbi:MAG TPA: PH domain-containing protein [Pseudonocardia sp.]|uniref:PH domain-containing protein n=1 Tax=Pseudonocardia sp. TaxID=60912 RepID=UPI002C4078A9|nr:PH domain-containing protein [Pseudonocardia sp.]HTF52479.1 PH domain-containing protein [Pseudonocardia sp.]
MDNFATPDSPAVYNYRWAPPLGLVVLGWLGALASAFWCFIATEPTGRLLAGVAVLVLASAALFGSRARPRLAADRAGLAVRGLGRAMHFDWSEVSRMRLVHTRRFGRDTPSLEIEARGPGDADDRLLVFGWLDLGTDPRDVADALNALRD